MAVTKVHLAAIENADKRLKEIDKLDFVVNAKADYYNGLVQDTWESVVASEQINIQEVLKAEARNRVLKRHIEWMQESFDKFYIGGIERYFGKKFYGDDDSRAE